MRLSGSGQQGVWMHSAYSSSVTGLFWGTTQTRNDVLQGLTRVSLVLYSCSQCCRKPTLFFFLWSSMESLSSASSPCRSETCISFSDNLVDDSRTTCYESNYKARSPWNYKCAHMEYYVSMIQHITHAVSSSWLGTAVFDCYWRREEFKIE